MSTYSFTETAAALRKTLRNTYSTRFSVRQGQGTGSTNLHIRYTDGPSEHSIRDLCAQYKQAPFPVNLIVAQREVSEEFLARGLERIEYDSNNEPIIWDKNTAYVPQTPYQGAKDVALAWCRDHDA